MKEHNASECRPDRCGLILEATQTTIGTAIVCREVRPGAFEESIANAWAYRMARQLTAYLYVVMAEGDRRAIFPPWVAHLANSAQNLVAAYKSWREVEAEEQAAKIAEASQLAAEERRRAEAAERKELERQQLRKQVGPSGQFVDKDGRLRLLKMRHPREKTARKNKKKTATKATRRVRRAIELWDE